MEPPAGGGEQSCSCSCARCKAPSVGFDRMLVSTQPNRVGPSLLLFYRKVMFALPLQARCQGICRLRAVPRKCDSSACLFFPSENGGLRNIDPENTRPGLNGAMRPCNDRFVQRISALPRSRYFPRKNQETAQGSNQIPSFPPAAPALNNTLLIRSFPHLLRPRNYSTGIRCPSVRPQLLPMLPPLIRRLL